MIVRRIDGWPEEEALYVQLYAGLPVPMPELTPSAWRKPCGIVAGFEDEALAGFVVFFAAEDKAGTAVAQWLLTDRERERLVTGVNTTHPGTSAEVEALAVLVGAAAEDARAAGYREIQWPDAEADLAARLAERMQAWSLGYGFAL